jgi:hypothetical protein
MREPLILRPDSGLPAGVRVAVSTRIGGFSTGPYRGLNLGDHVGDDPAAVGANRRILRDALGLPAEPCWLQQVHGIVVVDAGDCGGARPEADAAYVARPGMVCAVLTADCLPVVLAARDGREIAVAHCGWRGLAAGILAATLARFRCSPDEVVAWLGPGIGAGAFEVGAEVREAFLAVAADREAVAAAFEPGVPASGKFHADLCELARCALRAAGVNRIGGGGFCTVSDPERFYSYRRDGRTGRMATLAWIDPAQQVPA